MCCRGCVVSLCVGAVCCVRSFVLCDVVGLVCVVLWCGVRCCGWFVWCGFRCVWCANVVLCFVCVGVCVGVMCLYCDMCACLFCFVCCVVLRIVMLWLLVVVVLFKFRVVCGGALACVVLRLFLCRCVLFCV